MFACISNRFPTTPRGDIFNSDDGNCFEKNADREMKEVVSKRRLSKYGIYMITHAFKINPEVSVTIITFAMP